MNISPYSTPASRAAPPYVTSFQAKCNTYIERAEWIGLDGRLNRYENVLELSGFVQPGTPSLLEHVLETVVDIPIRFNYANCAGGGQIDFCIYIQGFSETTRRLATYRCGTVGANDLSFVAFDLTGEFLIGSRTVSPDVLFPDSFTPDKSSGTWIVINGNHASTSSAVSSGSSSSTSHSSSAVCRDLSTIPPEDFVANQQACECGGGVFSSEPTLWSCKYSKTIRGCSKGSDGKWQCGVGDV